MQARIKHAHSFYLGSMTLESVVIATQVPSYLFILDTQFDCHKKYFAHLISFEQNCLN